MLFLSERLPIALALAIDIALALAIGTGLALGLANAHDAKEKPEADEHGVRRAEVFSHPIPKAAYRNVGVITVEYPPGTESPKHGHDVAGDYHPQPGSGAGDARRPARRPRAADSRKPLWDRRRQ